MPKQPSARDAMPGGGKLTIETARPFDAVILNENVRAGVAGRDAIQKILEISPGVKAIVSSGYPRDSILIDFNPTR